MTTQFKQKLTPIALLAILLITMFVGFQLVQPAVAEADEPTFPFKLTKSISDNYTPDPFTADEFKFRVTGNGIDRIVDLTEFTVDTAEAITYLPAGSYTVAEVGPTGFIPADWTLQWSGPGCETSNDGNGPVRPIVITVASTSVDYPQADDVGNACKADNQWRGDDDGDDDPDPVVTTGTLLVSKVIIGTSTVPASNFSFTYTGASAGTASFELDGTNAVSVATGTYSVTEPSAAGYTTTYSNCLNLLVVAGSTSTACVITNTLNSGNGGGGNNATTGTLIIEKQTIPNGNQTAFTFNPSWSAVDFILLDNQQSTSTNLATGTYSIVESGVASWSQTSAVCSDGSPVTAITLSAGEIVTCVFTNTLITNGGGGDGDEPRYLVFGYVWHDQNENDTWDRMEANPANDESDLDGWVVQITNGSSTFSTTTDIMGYYYFYVPAGTWTLTETLQSGWQQTFPNVVSHTVIVEDESNIVTQAGPENFFQKLWSYVVPTAFAQTPTQYGPFDFGNVFFGSGGGGNGGNGGNGSGGGNGGGGGGRSNRNSGNNDNNEAEPKPLVLGDATNVMPVGAPNTGAGGAAPVNPVTTPTFVAVLSTPVVVRRTK